MTRDEFLNLPSQERKRLAAQRSTERALAKKEGRPLPPTLMEEFGVAGSSGNPRGKTKREKVGPKAEPKPAPRKKEVEVAPQPSHLGPKTSTPAGPVKSTIRTLAGFLHCPNTSSLKTFDQLARSRGMKKRLPYLDAGKIDGYIYFNSITEAELVRVRTILVGTKPEKRITFGKQERVG